MTLQDILNHPGGQEMVFEGEEMRNLLESIEEDHPKWPEALSCKEVSLLARRVRLSPHGTPAQHGIQFGYMIGRHWTYEPKDCKHDQFRIGMDMGRVIASEGRPESSVSLEEEPAYYSASIRIKCMHCGEPFEWVGLPFGFSPYRPTVSIDGQELRISAMPAGKTIPAGMPGFRVTHEVFDEKEAVKQ